MFVVNKNNKKIHMTSCRFAEETSEKNRLTYDALDNVYANHKKVKPCKNCMNYEDKTRKEIIQRNKF